MPSSTYKVNILINAKDQTGRGADTAKDKMSGLAKAAKFAAAGMLALKAAQKAIEFVKFGAKVDRAATALDNLAKGAGTSGGAIVKAIQGASDFTIDRMTAMSAANKALLLDVAQTPEQFERLTKQAVLLGRAMGQDAASSIDDFVTAAGRQSKQIADNLGLMVSAGDANERYAQSMGISVESMDDAARKQAFLNEMLRQAELKTGDLENATLDAATQMEQLSAAWQTLTQQVAEGTVEFLAERGTLEGVSDAIRVQTEVLGLLEKASKEEGATRVAMGRGAQAAIGKAIISSRTWQKDEDELRKALEATTDAIDDQTSSVEDEAAALEAMHAAMIKQVGLQAELFDAEAADAARAAIKGLDDLLKEDKIAVEDYALAVTGTQLAFGLTDKSAIQLASGIELLNERLANGEVTADEYDDQLELMVQAIDKANVSASEQEAILEANVIAMDKAAAAAKAAVTQQLGLAAAFKDASAATIASSAISELGQLLEDDKITTDQYKTAVMQTQLAFGLADEASIKLSENVLTLVSSFGDGTVKAGEFDEMLMGLIERTALERDEVEKLAEELAGLPDSKTIDIFVNTHTSGGGGGGNGGTAPTAGQTERALAEAWGIPEFQHGGLGTGMAMVGNEMVQLPPSSRVYNRQQSTNIANHYNMTVNTRARSPSVQQDFRMMQARIGA